MTDTTLELLEGRRDDLVYDLKVVQDKIDVYEVSLFECRNDLVKLQRELDNINKDLEGDHLWFQKLNWKL